MYTFIYSENTLNALNIFELLNREFCTCLIVYFKIEKKTHLRIFSLIVRFKILYKTFF